MFAIIKTVILIKKHIIKSTLTLKKVLFIGLLSLIFNSNLYSQLAAPSSADWNTVIQSDPYPDADGCKDKKYQDVYGNLEFPVFEAAVISNNIYFRVILNRKLGNGKKLKFFIGIDTNNDSAIDFFIHHEREGNKSDYKNDNKIKVYEIDTDDAQNSTNTTDWEEDYF